MGALSLELANNNTRSSFDHMTRATVALLYGLCFLALVIGNGCSRRPKNVARVKGKVTLGGQPLAGASVTFMPVEQGSTSRGRTDANGEYVLYYSRGVD